MYKKKPHRKNLFIDMTAMCDVAFLILALFILTAKPKAWRPVDVKEPLVDWNGMITEGSSHVGTVIIARDKVMFEIYDEDVRKQALQDVGANYGITFSKQEIEKFGKIQTIGVPVRGLQEYIDNYYDSGRFLSQPGIEMDSTSNELKQWIIAARKASIAINGHDLKLYVDADKRTPYPEIEKVFNTLKAQHIFKFDLNYYGKTVK